MVERTLIPLRFMALTDKAETFRRLDEYPLTVQGRKGAEIRAANYFTTSLFIESGEYAVALLFARS